MKRSIFKGSKKSAITRSAENDFERETRKLEQIDECMRQIHRDGKSVVEAMAALSKAESRLAAELRHSPHCLKDEHLLRFGVDWTQLTSHLDSTAQESSAVIQKALLDPTKKFSNIVPSMQSAIKKRDQALQEYNKWHAKVEKYQSSEHTGPNIVKLNDYKKLAATAKDEFDSQNEMLLTEMPKLGDLSLQYFQPCMQALVNCQLNYYTEAFKGYTELLPPNATNQWDAVGESDYEQRLAQRLADMRALSVVVD